MHTRKLALLVTFSLGAAAAAGCLSADGADARRDESAAIQGGVVAAQFQDNLDALHAAGISGVLGELHVGRHRFVARSGVARAGSTRPVPWDARFRIASNTKTFVAVVVLQLVGEGRLSLDDSVDRWLPGVVSGNGNDGTRITIRQLLQHTSGVPEYTGHLLANLTYELYLERRLDHYEPEDLVEIAMQHPPDFAPGASWSYSNTNYILAGMIIEAVTGHDWSAAVRERILAPLDLDDTLEPGDRVDVPHPHARGHEQLAEGGPLFDVTVQNQTFAGAAGSLISTTADMTRFWRELLRGRLLRPAQMAEMRSTVLATTFQEIWPGARYGLGIIEAPTSCGVTYWSHFGDTLGYATRNAISDDGRRVAVVALSSQLAGAASLQILLQGLQLLDDAMCAGR